MILARLGRNVTGGFYPVLPMERQPRVYRPLGYPRVSLFGGIRRLNLVRR